ncbi:MAG TPA: TIGR00645 family protein [Stenotrophomonas sp.]|nr:TIGR00645 family protein [Stenotrophomonas sp.]
MRRRPRHRAGVAAERAVNGGRLLQRVLSRSLFDARWLMAPFYFGLALALLILLFVFVRELVWSLAHLLDFTPTTAILMALALIDLSLVANLLLIVTLAGYENFVARIESGGERRPAWMGTVDFSGMKMKLMGSITAISAIALLRIFMKLEEGATPERGTLAWMTAIHGALMLSALVLAISDRIAARTPLPPVRPEP